MNIFLRKNITINNIAGMYKRCFREMCSADLRLRTNMFKNPCLDLQQYLEIPLFEREDVCFDPSFESIETARQCFTPRKDYDITCIAKAISQERFPCHDLPEVAFLGRSNAGKSSLMKAIFNDLSGLRIQTSSKPGQTKSLRFYAAGNNFCLVDVPGYGYRQPKWFDISVIPYLKTRKNLVKTFLLIDSAENYHAWDDAFLQILEDLKIPFANQEVSKPLYANFCVIPITLVNKDFVLETLLGDLRCIFRADSESVLRFFLSRLVSLGQLNVVLTKIDAVSDSQRLKTFLHVRKILKDFQINTFFPQIFMLSAMTFEGLAYFQAFICHITGNLSQKSNVKIL